MSFFLEIYPDNINVKGINKKFTMLYNPIYLKSEVSLHKYILTKVDDSAVDSVNKVCMHKKIFASFENFFKYLPP